jgi:hypothetical protein
MAAESHWRIEMTELKPCPFSHEPDEGQSLVFRVSFGMARIACEECDAEGAHVPAEESFPGSRVPLFLPAGRVEGDYAIGINCPYKQVAAIEVWNQRADSDGWVAVEDGDGLPGPPGWYLATHAESHAVEPTVDIAHFDGIGWNLGGVMAWRRLPTPYTPDREE